MKSDITQTTTMQTALDAFPGAKDALFARFHIGGCQSCGYALEDTIEKVSTQYKLNSAEVIETIRTAKPVEKRFGGGTIPLVAAPPANLGKIENADAIGSVGNASCGEMMTMWIKFKEDRGRKVIDRATFESFGCETAIALASRMTQLIKGRTPEQALSISREEVTGEMGPLPPIKIHCAELVEGALKSALETPAK